MAFPAGDDWDHVDRPTRVRYLVLAWLCAAALLSYIHRGCISVPARTIQKDLGLDDAQMSWAMSAFFLTYAIFQVPSGWLGDRWGTRRALSLFAALWSVATGGMALAGGFFVLLASRLATGMGQAGIFPCCVNTIAKWFPPAQRALPSGLLGSFMSWGQVVASALAGFALGFMSWQTLLLLFALPGVLWAVGFHSWFRDRPVEHPAVNGAELRLILASDSSASPTEDTGKKLNEEPSTAIQATPAEGAKHESATGPPTPADDPLSAGAVWWVVLTSIPMALICAQQFFRAAAYVFYQTWYPTFLQEAHGVTEEDSGYLAAVTIAGFALGAIVGGAAADFILARTGSRRLCRQGVAVASMSGAALCHAVAYFVGDALLAVALITLGAFASGMSGPAGYTITIDMGGRYVATVFSLMNMSGNLGGFLCPPLVTALVAAVGGDWNAALPLLVGWFLAAGLAWLFINPNGSIFDRHSNNKASGAA